MSNLLKYNSFVVKDADSYVIDSNQKVIDKINSIKKNIVTTNVLSPNPPDADGFVSGLSAQVVEELTEDETAAAQEEISVQTQEILDNARREGEEIVAQAHREAEQFINIMKNEGYEQGLKDGAEAVEEQKRKLEEEYQAKKQQLDKEYQKKVADIEPMLVDTFIKVFSNVTHTVAEDKKDMIIYLINSVMGNADAGKEFIIHVSPDDYRFTINNQNLITGAISKEVQIEISEDANLKKNECLIETESGVFDCSLDVQLNNLIKDIKMLSCMNN